MCAEKLVILAAPSLVMAKQRCGPLDEDSLAEAGPPDDLCVNEPPIVGDDYLLKYRSQKLVLGFGGQLVPQLRQLEK